MILSLSQEMKCWSDRRGQPYSISHSDQQCEKHWDPSQLNGLQCHLSGASLLHPLKWVFKPEQGTQIACVALMDGLFLAIDRGRTFLFFLLGESWITNSPNSCASTKRLQGWIETLEKGLTPSQINLMGYYEKYPPPPETSPRESHIALSCPLSMQDRWRRQFKNEGYL